MTEPADDTLSAFLAASPPGFAEWWLSSYGGEEFTTEEERDGFTMAVISREAALQYASGLPLDPDRERAAYCKARGLAPPDDPAVPHVVTG